MKKFIVVLLVLLAVAGYFLYPKAPKFVRVNNINLLSLNKNKLKTELEFTNPNYFSLELVSQNIEVFISDRHIGDIVQKDGRYIHSQENFSLPVDLNFDKKEVFGKTGFGRNLLSSIFNNNLTVRFTGVMTVKALGITLPVVVDYTKKLTDTGNEEK